MNKNVMKRALAARGDRGAKANLDNGAPKPRPKTKRPPTEVKPQVAEEPKKPEVPKKDLQKELQGAKTASGTGDHEFALTLYMAIISDFKDSKEFKNVGNQYQVLVLAGKAALAAKEKEEAQSLLQKAVDLMPNNPQGWKGLVDLHTEFENNAGLVTALTRSLEIADQKQNWIRSRSLRLQLADVKEKLGFRSEALECLRQFQENGEAWAAQGADAAHEKELLADKVAALMRGESSLGIGPALEAARKLREQAPIETGQVSPATASPSPAPSEFGSCTSLQALEAHSAHWITLGSVDADKNMNDLENMGDEERVEQLTSFLEAATTEADEAAKRGGALGVAQTLAVSCLEAPWLAAQLKAHMQDGSSVSARTGALLTLQAICDVTGSITEPYVITLLPQLLSNCSDSVAIVRDTALLSGASMFRIMNPYALRAVLPVLMEGIENREWRTKVGALHLLSILEQSAPSQLAVTLPEIVPTVSHAMWDTKQEVQVAAKETLMKACAIIGNPDIAPLTEQLVTVIAKPEQTMQTLDALLATTFVSAVDSATLSVIAPLLGKCLRERSLEMKRKASRVITNMCKLVVEPADVAPFVPLLLPRLRKVCREVADPEIAEVAREALDSLKSAMGSGKVAERAKTGVAGPSEEELTELQKELVDQFAAAIAASGCEIGQQVQSYMCSLCASLVLFGQGPASPKQRKNWSLCIEPYLSSFMTEAQAEELCESVREAIMATRQGQVLTMEDGDLCNIEFSLAYGGKILLHNTGLHLRMGRKYCLVGRNGVGKTTLMRNIASGNIEGLPTNLKTVFVQHDLVGSDLTTHVLEWMVKEATGATREEVAASLSALAFTEEMQASPVSALSGGWKMKLALARAMLLNADILLLDEPTNHLDAKSVAWLTNYLQTQEKITCLLVSHDTSFLDAVGTDILHYEGFRLVHYPGTLTEFVEVKPEAKHYYELSSNTIKFRFPNPGPLDGINSTTKSILTMENAGYTYPGSEKPTLERVNLKLCLASRVAVVGANGAGKTTLIKLVVKETEPESGRVWSHHNLRVAYVAQHSFHHVEQHLDKSPVQYMQWRYGAPDGTDREAIESNTGMRLTDEEKEKLAKAGQVETILGRRKTGKTLEYECSFVGYGPEYNRYIPLEKMIDMGLSKLVQQADARTAAMAAGLDLRPVTTREIQSHLDDFGLAEEFGVHGKVRGLSGGQKVKLVLAAAMWNRPHLLVLDEPTNYLDRESLGALTEAIKSFGGGVIMISHHQEFLSALCSETWLLEGGRLYTKGEAEERELKTSRSDKEKPQEKEEEKSSAGCTNATVDFSKVMNPKTLKVGKALPDILSLPASSSSGLVLGVPCLMDHHTLSGTQALSKKEIRKIQKLAEKANVGFLEYLGGITRQSPEWKWL
ncbi:unnamed protein product [Chrysoparadoxa australica]